MSYWLQKKLLNILVFLKLGEYLIHYPFSHDRIRNVQNRELHRLMKHAYSIPFYRKKFDEAHITYKDIKTEKDLEKLPITTKAELRTWIRTEYEKNPAKYRNWFKDSTSGSTGAPLEVYLTPMDKASNMANWLRMAIVHGINPFMDKTFCLVSPHRLKKRDSIIQKLGILSRKQVSYLADPKKMVQEYTDYCPKFMYANKSQYVQMAIEAKRREKELPKPKAYASAAEKLDAKSRQIIESVFGEGNLYDTYGSTETGALAFEKPGHKNLYEICHDTHIVHTMNEHGEYTNDGGKAIITSLYYKGFPIINYELGDWLKTERHDGLLYLREIDGRADDWIKFANGEKAPFHYFYEAFEKQKAIKQFRVIQKQYDSVEIQLVAGERNVSKEIIESEVRKQLFDTLHHEEVAYSFVWKNELKPEKNGKLRMLISEI